jgi:hypothetical protein
MISFMLAAEDKVLVGANRHQTRWQTTCSIKFIVVAARVVLLVMGLNGIMLVASYKNECCCRFTL